MGGEDDKGAEVHLEQRWESKVSEAGVWTVCCAEWAEVRRRVPGRMRGDQVWVVHILEFIDDLQPIICGTLRQPLPLSFQSIFPCGLLSRRSAASSFRRLAEYASIRFTVTVAKQGFQWYHKKIFLYLSPRFKSSLLFHSLIVVVGRPREADRGTHKYQFAEMDSFFALLILFIPFAGCPAVVVAPRGHVATHGMKDVTATRE